MTPRRRQVRSLTAAGLYEPLSCDELQLLRDLPYDKPRPVGKSWKQTASILVARGLLEHDGHGQYAVYRCTDRGALACRELTRNGCREIADHVLHELPFEERRVLIALLHERILIEISINGAVLDPHRLEIITQALRCSVHTEVANVGKVAELTTTCQVPPFPSPEKNP